MSPLSKVAPGGAIESNLQKIAFEVESRPRWQLMLCVLLFLLPSALCAHWKPLTNDELFTFEVSRLASVGRIWTALSAGADNHPPLDYLLRHLSLSAFGQSELAFRLPSLLASYLCLISIFHFVVRRASVVYGLIAVLIPLSTPLFEYSYEARSYTLLAAFAAVALAAWQRRTEGSRGAIVVLAASLAAVLWAHYYGVLVFLPIAAGEMVRTQKTRRIDLAVWAALAAAACALLPLLPMIRSARQIGSVFWTKVGLVQALSIYPALLDRLVIVLVIISAILIVTGIAGGDREPERGLRAHEAAAVLGILVLPLLAYLLAKSVTGALAPRYVLATVVGIAIAFTFAAREVFGGAVTPAFVVLAALGLSALGGELTLAKKQRQLRAELNHDDLAQIVAGRPGSVVVMDNDLVMQLWHYEPQPIADRLVYVSDEKAALELYGWNTTERAFAGLQPFSKNVHVRTYADFVRGDRRFTLIDAGPGHVTRELLRNGAEIRMIATYRNQFVLDVQLPAGPTLRSLGVEWPSKLRHSAAVERGLFGGLDGPGETPRLGSARLPAKF